MKKWDICLMNPPYDKTLHIDIFNKVIDLIKEKLVVIEPATWLIDVRQKIVESSSYNMKKYIMLKQKLSKHIYKVVIENYNKEFDTSMYVPFSVTYIDMKNEYDIIDFWCCGDHKTVNNIYDCNLIGNYNMIYSIINKIKAYGDTMKNHIYIDGKTKIDKNTWFCKFAEIVDGGIGMSTSNKGSSPEKMINSQTNIYNTIMGDFFKSFIDVYSILQYNISKTFHYTKKRGSSKEYTDKLANQFYGSKEELENWKHFIFNNKIPLFTSIVLVISQNNRVKQFIPWLVDKKYSDDEIYELLGITKEEQDFIDKTLKKYEKNSPWFKRYLCGKDSVSNEEVQKFIDNLK